MCSIYLYVAIHNPWVWSAAFICMWPYIRLHTQIQPWVWCAAFICMWPYIRLHTQMQPWVWSAAIICLWPYIRLHTQIQPWVWSAAIICLWPYIRLHTQIQPWDVPYLLPSCLATIKQITHQHPGGTWCGSHPSSGIFITTHWKACSY